MATEDKRIDQLDPVSVLDLTGLMAMQQGTNAKKVTLQQLLDYLKGQIDTGNAVLFVSQKLSDAQKLQARINIGAAAVGEGGGGTLEGAVLYTEQTLTDAQKGQARANIEAVTDINWYNTDTYLKSTWLEGQNRIFTELKLVRYDADQTGLTEEQKAQARTNIGAAASGEGGGGTLEGAVLYTEQRLTEEQQKQARENIRCGIVGISRNCVASGLRSSAQGEETEATGNYSHSEGQDTLAGGSSSHAEGRLTEATGNYSHSEGFYTEATGESSHAEGYYTDANGRCSHAEGYYTDANGRYSHVEGFYTVATSWCQHVIGTCNVVDESGEPEKKGKYVYIVGNGSDDYARSNAHTLDWDGVPWYASNRIMLGGTGMDDENAVALMPVFVPQELTEEQKLQARTNIGAMAKGDTEVKVTSKAYLNSYKIVVTVNGVESEGPAMSLVRYDVNQTGLTEEQKAQARANIGVDAYIEQVFLGGEW